MSHCPPWVRAARANAEHDVLAHMGFPAAHRAKLHSTNPIERLNGEIKRRTEVVGIFPDAQAIYHALGSPRRMTRAIAFDLCAC